MYPNSLTKLIESLKMLPGVGQKTAERYALSLLDAADDDVARFAMALRDVKTKITTCAVCHNLSETNRCDICQDMRRDATTICVVASPKEVFSIEKTGMYNGVYHVLGGLISTQKGIMPQNLTIDALVQRSHDAHEIILALNATVEGEMTALYIAKRLEGVVNTTRLAFGLPIGGQLDYADDLTLQKAFEGRHKIQ